MNFSLSAKYENAGRFCIDKLTLVFLSDALTNPRLTITGDYGIKEIFLPSPLQEIYAYGDFFYSNDFNGMGVIISKEGEITHKEYFIQQIVTMEDEPYTIGMTIKDIPFEDRKAFICHSTDFENAWFPGIKRPMSTIPYKERLIWNTLDSEDLCFVSCLSIKEKKELWRCNVQELRNSPHSWSGNEPVEIIGISGVYNEKMIVTTRHAGLLILNVGDGSIARYFNLMIFPAHLYPSGRSNIFYGINYKTYLEVDLNTNEIINIIELEKILPIQPMLINNITEYKGLVFFTIQNRYICIIDPHTKSYVYHFDFFSIEKRSITPYKFQIMNDKIYLVAYDKKVQSNFYILDIKP